MEHRKIDTSLWINELSEILKADKNVPLNVTGNSMLPFLKENRDKVILTKFASPAKKGDILLLKRPDGSYILHRATKVIDNKIWLTGDFQSVTEGPFDDSLVIAKVIKVRRNNKWYNKNSHLWQFYSKIWIRTVKYRKYLTSIYLSIKNAGSNK